MINLSIHLTQKEKMLLQDQKKHEEVCIEKYTNYGKQAQDPQLQQLFNTFASQEQQHLNTINQILDGQVPKMNQQQGQQQNLGQNQQGQQAGQVNQGTIANQGDAVLCKDMLMTEKYVSSTYDTAIFETVNSNVRQVLNHIQKEEQQHGEGIFNFMMNQGMYNPQ